MTDDTAERTAEFARLLKLEEARLYWAKAFMGALRRRYPDGFATKDLVELLTDDGGPSVEIRVRCVEMLLDDESEHLRAQKVQRQLAVLVRQTTDRGSWMTLLRALATSPGRFKRAFKHVDDETRAWWGRFVELERKGNKPTWHTPEDE
jgi:Trp operon repressor